MKEGEGNWDHYTTPEHVLERVRMVGPILLDPCSNGASTVGARMSLNGAVLYDGLATPWHDIDTYDGLSLVYVNPPYSRGQIGRWSKKIVDESMRGCEIIALVPSRTGSIWFQALLCACDATCFVTPRIRSCNPPPGKSSASPRFDNAIMYFGRGRARFASAFEIMGVVR